MHPNGSPTADGFGYTDADYQAAGRETQNTTWPGPQNPDTPAEEAAESPAEEAAESYSGGSDSRDAL